MVYRFFWCRKRSKLTSRGLELWQSQKVETHRYCRSLTYDRTTSIHLFEIRSQPQTAGCISTWLDPSQSTPFRGCDFRQAKTVHSLKSVATGDAGASRQHASGTALLASTRRSRVYAPPIELRDNWGYRQATSLLMDVTCRFETGVSIRLSPTVCCSTFRRGMLAELSMKFAELYAT